VSFALFLLNFIVIVVVGYVTFRYVKKVHPLGTLPATSCVHRDRGESMSINELHTAGISCDASIRRLSHEQHASELEETSSFPYANPIAAGNDNTMTSVMEH
jgi:hypothetical protein